MKTNNGYIHFLQRAKDLYGEDFIFPHIEEEYINNKSKITIRCSKCGNEITKRANDFLNPITFQGCKVCRDNMAYHITYEELSHIAGGNKIQPFEGYKDKRKDNVVAICPIHGEYMTRVSSVIKGKYSCRKCVGHDKFTQRKLTKEEFSERLKEKYGDSVAPFMDEYVDTCTNMRFRCNTCGRVFSRTPNSFMFSKLKDPCPYCSKEKAIEERTKSKEQFIKDAISVWGNDKYNFDKTIYTKSAEKVVITCNECGRDFEIEANSFLSGKHGCPYHNCNSSIKEKEISEFITSIGIENITNDRSALNGKELDIYIPSFSIGIEFDGIFWHNELYKPNDYHLRKTEECGKAHIRLIHIFEDEWLYKKDIWKSMLRNLFGKIENKIYARKCEIKNVNSKDASTFLEENHIQGKCGSSIRYGLYYNDELVSLMTFGKTRHFIGNNSHQYELLRFCNKINTNVVGGASKLFKHFIREYNPQNIVSYADRRWSIGNLYEKLGFELYNISKPNYFYVIDNKRHNRFNFRKSVLVEKYDCPKDLSERDFCKSQKWWRIYDCGALCFEWKNKKEQPS